MYKLQEKTIKGSSPLIVEKAANQKTMIFPKGYSKQETRSGKNKFKIKDSSTTYNGITYSTKNNIVTFNGTMTSGNALELGFPIDISIFTGKYYKMSIKVSGTISGNQGMSAFTSTLINGTSTWEWITHYSKAKTPSADGKINYLRFYIPQASGSKLTFTNYQVKIQIEEVKNADTSATKWEQYGASPTPEFPSEIRNIGDNINLFDIDIQNQITNGVTLTKNDDGTYSLKGTATAQTMFATFIDLGVSKIVNNKAYTFSSNKILPNGIDARAEFYKDNTWLRHVTGNSITNSRPIVTGITNNTDANRIRNSIVIASGTTVDVQNLGIKLEQGSIATPYTPYNCGSIDLKVENENLYNESIKSEAYYYNTSGVKTADPNGLLYKNQQINLKSNSLMFAWDSSYNNPIIRICEYKKDNTFITRKLVNTDITKYFLYTKSTDTDYIIISVDTSSNKHMSKLQINEGTKILPYVEHQEKTIHFPLAENQVLHEGDYLADDGIHQNRKTLVLTGEEGWNKNYVDTTKTISQYYVKIDDSIASSNVICTHAKNGKENKKVYLNSGKLLVFQKPFDEDITLDEFKSYLKTQYNAGTPVTIEYELAEEIIIPYTSEQLKIINTIKLFEGYNEITSLNEFDFDMTVQYYPQITDEIKQAFKTGVTKAYLDVLEDDYTIQYDNYLKDIEFSDLRFVPGKGIFGQAVAKQIVVNLNNVDNSLNLEDKTLRFYLETELNGKKYRINYGDFIVQHPENENVNDNTSFTALDYMVKTNVKFNDTIAYPCTLRQLAENVCSQCGLELSYDDFLNEDFIVENNQFVNGESCRQVLQAIALSAFSWVRIDEDNIVNFDFKVNNVSRETIDTDCYYNLDINSKEYGPVNRIILRNSQIEGENVTISDEESIKENDIHELVIEDNPFAYTQEKREQLIQAGTNIYGFKYLPINSSKLIGYTYLNCLDLIEIEDVQKNKSNSYLFNHVITYNGAALDTVECPALTETETKYTYTPTLTRAIQQTQVIVDKANQTITSIVQKQTDQGEQLVNIQTDLVGVKTTIKDNQDTINEKINQIEQTVEGTKQILTNSGGNNIFNYAKDFWSDGTENGNANLEEYTSTEIQQKSVSGNGYRINKGTSEQKVQVKNENYTISFTYKKLINLAKGYVLVNGTQYDLTSTDWKEQIININVDTNSIDLKIVSDTANSFEIFDLMGNIGTEKQVWTQNPNETRTDTVTIGKGIQVNSSSRQTYTRIDADGNRVFSSRTNQPVAQFTDKGLDANEVKSNVTNTAGILIQEINGQTWISSLL